jgi:YegS/Rv2252/BmrU family lipid kinase
LSGSAASPAESAPAGSALPGRGSDETWLAIVNPVAGRSRGKVRAWLVMERALRGAGLQFDLEFTTSPGDGKRIAEAAIRRGCSRFLIAGGDGSVHDVVNGVFSARRPTGSAGARADLPTLVPLPLGTGNDWSRTLELPHDPARLAAIIRRNHTHLHDVGRIDFAAAPGSSNASRWFINVAGAGFDAHVIERMPARTPSSIAYLGAALRELGRYRSPCFRIETAGDDAAIEGRLLLAFVAIGRYCGGRMHVAPTARQDDGAFDVVTIDEVGLLRALPKLARLYLGSLLQDPLVRYRLAERVRIEASPQAGIEADGQLVGRTPAEFSIVRGALQVLRGP